MAQRGEPIRRPSLVDEIASRLKRDILDGHHAPGQTLPPERELAARYGVTRTSLKHALVRLEQLGLIRTRHGVGSVVQDVTESGGADLLRYLVPGGARPDARFLREILEARSLIAGGIARMAARRRSAQDLAALQRVLEELSQIDDDDARQAQRLENEFARTLARASGNRAFVLLTNSVSAAYRLDLKTFEPAFRDVVWLELQLRGIHQAVTARDEAGAGLATEAYFDEAARRVLASTRRSRKKEG